MLAIKQKVKISIVLFCLSWQFYVLSMFLSHCSDDEKDGLRKRIVNQTVEEVTKKEVSQEKAKKLYEEEKAEIGNVCYLLISYTKFYLF